MRRLTPIFTIFLLVQSLQLQAQSLSLEQAAHLTFQHNPTIQAAEYNTLAARRNSQAARGLYAPKIALHGAWIHTQKDIGIDFNSLKPLFSQFDISSLLGLDWNLTIQNRSFGFLEADITVPIFTGGKIIAANRAAQSIFKATSAEEQAIKAEIFTTLVERYFGHTFAQQVLKVRQQVVKTISEHLQEAEVMFDNGVITKADVLFLRYRLAEALQQQSTAENSLKLSQQALQSTLSADSLGNLSTKLFYIEDIGSITKFKESAELSNHKLEYAHQMQQAAQQNINICRAAFMPQIAAMGGGAITHNVTNIIPRWAVGIGVSFTIFDGTIREYKYLAAKSMCSAVKQKREVAENDIILLVESLYNTVTDAINRIKTARTSIDFTSELLHYRRQAFAEGVATSAQVSDAITAQAVAQIELIEAVYLFDSTLAKLLEAAGLTESYFDYSNSVNRQIVDYEKYKEDNSTYHSGNYCSSDNCNK